MKRKRLVKRKKVVKRTNTSRALELLQKALLMLEERVTRLEEDKEDNA